MSVQSSQGFQALIHAALTSFALPTAAHVVRPLTRSRLVQLESESEIAGTQMDRSVFAQMSSQSTKVFAAETDPSCRANLASIEELQLTSQY